ncbi:hypothetical protein COOONC_10286 [Cooperia oncophora]
MKEFERNDTVLNNTAVAEYEEAAREFIVRSLKDARELRQQTLWGLYGFPYCNYNAGTKNESRCSQQYQDFNNRKDWSFDEICAPVMANISEYRNAFNCNATASKQ